MEDEEPKPNIRWTGVRNAKPVAPRENPLDEPDTNIPMFVDDEPPIKITIGMMTIELPDAEMQKEGWYSDQARLIISCMPGYKRIV